MSARVYNGGSAATTISSGIAAGTTAISVADASTWPSSGAFSIVLDRGLTGEEKILIGSRVGNALTATTRGYDGTTAGAHTSGATAECCGTAIDFQEANDHNNSVAAVHTGTSLSPAILILPGTTVPAETTEGSVVWDTDDDLLTVGTGAGRKTQVNLDSAQTLTNKTLTAPVIATISNTGTLTLPTSTDTLVGKATTDVLTNKTLTTPTINGAVGGTASFTGTTLDATSTLGGVSGTTVAADHAAWTAYTPVVGGTGWAIGNGTVAGHYLQMGKTLHIKIGFNAGTTTTFGSGSLTLSLPGGMATPSSSEFAYLNGRCTPTSGFFHVIGELATPSNAVLLLAPSSSTATTYVGLTSTTPSAWSSSQGKVFVSGTIEIA